VTIRATTPAVTGPYPGGPAWGISGNVDNPNAGSGYIDQVSVAVASGSSIELLNNLSADQDNCKGVTVDLVFTSI
jgi:hypothetical protein